MGQERPGKQQAHAKFEVALDSQAKSRGGCGTWRAEWVRTSWTCKFRDHHCTVVLSEGLHEGIGERRHAARGEKPAEV